MNCWVQISAGQGPAECMRAVWHILKKFNDDVQKHACKSELLSSESGCVNKSFKSVLLKIAGKEIKTLQQEWQGSVCWKGKSPFRPNHRRQNWFVQVNFISPPQESEIDLKQIRFETLRGGGPGGQHVNKTSTAVRATYLPTGLAVFCQEERSQLRNKELAVARLFSLLNEEIEDQQQKNNADNRLKHYQLERGNPVKTFKGKL